MTQLGTAKQTTCITLQHLKYHKPWDYLQIQ